jgi:hypothetical protein
VGCLFYQFLLMNILETHTIHNLTVLYISKVKMDLKCFVRKGCNIRTLVGKNISCGNLLKSKDYCKEARSQAQSLLYGTNFIIFMCQINRQITWFRDAGKWKTLKCSAQRLF